MTVSLIKTFLRVRIQMKLFVKIFNGFQPVTIFGKHIFLNVWQGSEYTTEISSEWLFLFI